VTSPADPGMPAPSNGPRPSRAPRPSRRRRALTWTIVTVIILAIVGGGGFFAWNTFGPSLEQLLGANQPGDYPGDGTTATTVTIDEGATGLTVAGALQKAGVVKTSDAFYQLLLRTKPAPVFQPGVYRVKKEMSAKAALAALQNPKNRLEHTITIPEGDTEAIILPALAKATGIPLSDFRAATASPSSYGLPAQAKNLDGYLFPATYTLDPGLTARQIVQTLVDRADQAFTEDGVSADPTTRWNTVVLASIVQKEAGSDADMGKVARVFTNRLADGMNLQSDATVAYGAGVTTVFTTDAERADAANPYNTYANPGLPVGPISNPGDSALKAAVTPTPGAWIYFTTVNLETGETVFSTDIAGQDAAVAQLQAWCAASAANDAYCQ
jgi:UPF0755 protein